MAARGMDRREQHGMGAGTPRRADLAQVVRGRQTQRRTGRQARRRAIALARNDESMAEMAAEARKLHPPALTRAGRQMIVAKDQRTAAWQMGQGPFEHRVIAAVADENAGRDRVALCHGRAIAPPMADTTPESSTPLAEVRDRMARAARLAHRALADVTLIAVSKTHEAPAILPLIEQGQRVFGENRVQEAEAKWPALVEAHPGLSLHLVGQLQSNKAEQAVRLFDCIHSLDRPSLLTALARAMDKVGRQVPLFVQVNIAGEEQKGGCALADLPALLQEARAAQLPVCGLMCVPPAGIEAAPFFALLDKLAEDHGLEGRSMGMSDDFETAIQLGATHIRVGSALFGARPPFGQIP